MDLARKVAIVTGASKGIGKAIALALARLGVDVVVAARTLLDLKLVEREIQSLGRKALAVPADVSKEADVEHLVKQTLSTFDKIDILVNNAGIGYFAKVVEMETQDFDNMFATNTRGVFLCTKAVLPTMINQRSGDIINIASLAGRNAFVGGAGYAATKWALIGFARSVMLEVREYGIRVITVCPGSVDTSFDPRSKAKHQPDFGLAGKNSNHIPKAEDIAQVVVNALLMPRNVMVSEIDVRPTNPH